MIDLQQSVRRRGQHMVLILERKHATPGPNVTEKHATNGPNVSEEACDTWHAGLTRNLQRAQ